MEKTPEIRIRNVNAAAIARIDQLAAEESKRKGHKVSRNQFLRTQIEAFATLTPLQEQEERYTALVESMGQIIEAYTREQQKAQLYLERILAYIEDGKKRE